MKRSSVLLWIVSLFMSVGVAFAASPVTDSLVLHLEADAITGVANGATIASWPATVGSDGVVVRSADPNMTDPNFVANVSNGMPAVNFDGADNVIGSYIKFARRTDIRTVYWVIKENPGANQTGFMLGDTSAYHFHRNIPGDGRNGEMWNTQNGWTHRGIINGTTRINGAKIDGVTTKPPTYLSVVSLVTTEGVTASTFSCDRTQKGRQWNGLLAELLIFNRPLTPIEDNAVGKYLADKYGLTTTYTSDPLVPMVLRQSPANKAKRQGQDISFTWDSLYTTGTVTYDVYLGTEMNSLSKLATVSDPSYTPSSPLDPNQTYFWRVDINDDDGVQPGEVLSFYTGGNITGVWPADGAIRVATDGLVITWDGDSAGSTYIDSYDIYFGETIPGAPIASVSDNQWLAPQLNDNTTYQIKIVSKHAGAVVSEGPVSSFTTGGLISYWPLDGDLVDTIGDNDGIRGTPHFAEGYIGAQSADFAGDFAQDPIKISTADIPSGGTFSFTFWEYSYAESPGAWETIIANGDPTGYEIFEMGRYNGKRYVWGINWDQYKATPNDDSFLREFWHFHALVYDSNAGIAYWYVDGALANTYSIHMNPLKTYFCVGNALEGSQPFNGKVDDIKLYNKAISLDEVITEFVNGAGGAPILPVPSSGTTEVAWDVVLEWTGSGDTTSQTLEIGKMSDLSDAQSFPLAGDVRSFDVVAKLGHKLDLNTQYAWRVTATLPKGDVESATWLFTVRDLTTDLNGDLKLNGDDLGMIAGKWLDDTSATPPDEYLVIDQDAWDVTGGDPNITNYDRYAVGDDWSASTLTIKTDPTPGTGNYTPPSQTLLWTCKGTSGQQGLIGVNYVQGVINFNDFDKMGFWAYGRNTNGNFQLRAKDVNGNTLTEKTIWGMDSNNNKWFNYEWDIVDNCPNVDHYDIWVGDNEFTWEFGNFYLKKNDTTVKLCLPENLTNIEDINRDCMVNLNDVAIIAVDWLLDASN